MSKIVIIGAGGNVGSAAATVLAARHEVIAASRSTTPSVDADDTRSIQALFDVVGQVDAVIVATGAVPFRPVAELTDEDVLAAFTGKIRGHLNVLRVALPHVRDGGSFTLTGGITAREAVAGGAVAALANGALESFVLTAATEMPRGIRINAVSPTILEGTDEYYSVFAGFTPIAASVVGQAFVRCVEGVQTGRVLALD